MEDLSKIVETLAANNQKLRVAVTKTSTQGEEAQKTTPNMTSLVIMKIVFGLMVNYMVLYFYIKLMV